MKRLYIDDIRTPKSQGWDIVRTSSEAIEYLINKCPMYISFDHDLGGDDTAMIIVKWMVERDLDNPGFIPDNFKFNVHSANPIGADNIENYLNRYLKFRRENEIKS
jgi:hypothetical protein